jgi:hypothetical protein
MYHLELSQVCFFSAEYDLVLSQKSSFSAGHFLELSQVCFFSAEHDLVLSQKPSFSAGYFWSFLKSAFLPLFTIWRFLINVF